MLLQSCDFAELNRHYRCTLQIGGSDQWGNITGGIDLTRRLNQQQVFGLTLPLVTKADGSKFGKTESGTVWLSAQKTSPYAFYQFWMNTADADVYKFLRYFTFLPVSEIEQIEKADASVQGRKSAQGILAAEVTRLVHGETGLQAAKRISDALFENSYSSLTEHDVEQLGMDGMPTVRVAASPQEEHSSEQMVIDILANSELARGNKQAREFIANGAVTVNGSLYQKDGTVSPLYEKYFILRRGKKNFCLAILEGTGC
jgi:tyrosyl-tRNA synthetase